MTYSDVELARAYLPILMAEKSLHEFTKQFWVPLEGPNKPFVDSWHVGAVCEHLEAAKAGQVRNLIFNLPPRCLKSTIISVLFVPWWWSTNPSTQFYYASHGLDLAMRDNVRARRIIEHDLYQKNWGHTYELAKDQNTKKKFENNMNGFRACTSTGAGSTGQGGNVRICDDPNIVSIKPNQSESDVTRESANEWFSAMWSTRYNDPKRDISIIVQQRTHEKDITGYVQSLEDITNQEWVKVILPMEYEGNRKCKTISLPSTKGKIWEDPRTKEGELLFPDFMDLKELNKLKAALGNAYRIAGQLQQRPAPADGGIMKKSSFKWWKEPERPALLQVIQSWDCALEAKEMDSYSACTTWGIFNEKITIPGSLKQINVQSLILLGVWRGRVEYPELRAMAQRLAKDYRDDGSTPLKPDPQGLKFIPDVILVEAKASGHSLIQDLRRAGVFATPFDPGIYGDKIFRVRLCTPVIEAGRVWLPALPPTYDKLRSFSQTLLDMCAIFPNSESRDIVDTMSQVILKTIGVRDIIHPTDEVRSGGGIKPKHGFYEP